MCPFKQECEAYYRTLMVERVCYSPMLSVLVGLLCDEWAAVGEHVNDICSYAPTYSLNS